MSLEGKSVIVTGGASGIGAASAKVIASRGGKVMVADVNQEMGEAVVSEIVAAGGVARFQKTDVTSREQVRALAQRTQEAYGGIDAVAHVAAIALHKPFIELDDELWRRTIDVCLTGTFYLNQEVAKVMIEQGHGRIINFASTVAATGGELLAAYSAAKAGVVALSKSIQKELARHNIVVIVVAPGATDTPLWRLGRTEEQLERRRRSQRFGRVATAEEVGSVVAFLAGDESGATLAGQTIHTNGGQFMGF